MFPAMVTRDAEKFQRAFFLLLLVFISALFFAMIRRFLLTLLLAAILSGLAHPLYGRVLRIFRGRRTVASATTLLLLLLVVGLPALAFLAVVAREALLITEEVRPWVTRYVQEPGALERLLDRVPGSEHLETYREPILTKAGQVVEALGNYIFHTLSAATRGTFTLFFHFFLMLYVMFYFLRDGKTIMDRLLYYLPLPHDDETRLVGKFVSVTRATLKGTLIIGAIQGALAGAAFAVAGIRGAVFWGTVMAFLSLVPGIGIGLVWIPASLYLLISGQTLAGILLAAFCGGVVGSVDNVLRPRLVGKDTRMHDLFILLGTLGGIFLFGVLGFIIGPIIAALFVTVWEIYGVAFRNVLPAVGGRESGSR